MKKIKAKQFKLTEKWLRNEEDLSGYIIYCPETKLSSPRTEYNFVAFQDIPIETNRDEMKKIRGNRDYPIVWADFPDKGLKELHMSWVDYCPFSEDASPLMLVGSVYRAMDCSGDDRLRVILEDRVVSVSLPELFHYGERWFVLEKDANTNNKKKKKKT